MDKYFLVLFVERYVMDFLTVESTFLPFTHTSNVSFSAMEKLKEMYRHFH